MKPEELDELIDRCKRKDTLAQRAIYDHFSGLMFAVCLRYSSNYEDAQDCFQEAFVTIFKKITQYKNKGSFEGWMRRIMVNDCLGKYRSRKGVYLTTDIDIPEEEEMEPVDTVFTKKELLETIQQLPDQYRLVFNLYVMENYTHQEIAEELNISVGTSKSNLSRARNWLKNKLKDSGKFHKLPQQYLK